MINISIIMPLYNAEKYLDEALQSIQRQTYKDFELICIDDASTDATMDILRRVQSRDDRIRIFSNKERLGAAVSRNRGLHEAKGEYISFLDGDDIFEEEMLESAYRAAKKNDVDIVMFEYKHVQSKNIYEKQFIQHSDKFREKYCQTAFSVKQNKPFEYMRWSSAPCDKLYKKSFIDSNHLVFQDLSSCNDVYFVSMALLLSEKTIMLDDSRVMVYARDHDVPTRISYDRDPMCAYAAMDKLGRELLHRGMFNEVFQHYYCALFFTIQSALLKTKKEENARFFYDFLKNGGIARLVDLSPECYQKTDSYIQKLLHNFNELEFSTGWYKHESILSGYLNMNSETMTALFQDYFEPGMQIVVWGAGRNGKALLNFFAQHNIEADYVIDKDKNKHGTAMDGRLIKRPEEVLHNGQLVIVSSRYIDYKEYQELLEGSKTLLLF